ncbi:hypothetical protein C8Q74DRAFT_449271 [Fomes fomentarius]|nr:hypothetical protein C8Q74DRAFT_449271 [Fomes fomentarius]
MVRRAFAIGVYTIPYGHSVALTYAIIVKFIVHQPEYIFGMQCPNRCIPQYSCIVPPFTYLNSTYKLRTPRVLLSCCHSQVPVLSIYYS